MLSLNYADKTKMLLFKDSKHEEVFKKTNIMKEDNYQIIHSINGIVRLDNIILPLQNMHRNPVHYELIDELIAEVKTNITISKHKK